AHPRAGSRVAGVAESHRRRCAAHARGRRPVVAGASARTRRTRTARHGGRRAGRRGRRLPPTSDSRTSVPTGNFLSARLLDEEEPVTVDSPDPKSVSRVAIVTGAGRGIGAAVARRLADDGFAVGLIDLDEAGAKAGAEAITAAGGKAVGIAADISDADEAERAVGTVADELGPPTVLVNNAGITRDNLL